MRGPALGLIAAILGSARADAATQDARFAKQIRDAVRGRYRRGGGSGGGAMTRTKIRVLHRRRMGERFAIPGGASFHSADDRRRMRNARKQERA